MNPERIPPEWPGLTHRLMKIRFPADRETMGIPATALRGLQQAEAQLERSAAKVAAYGRSDSSGSGSPVDTVDLATEMVSQISAQDQFAVDLMAIKTSDQMLKSAIDLLA